MFCAKCGAQISDAAKFCPRCGSPVKAPQNAVPDNDTPELHFTPPTSVPPSSPAASGDQPKKKTISPKIIIAAVAAVAIIVVLVLCLSGKGGYDEYDEAIDAYFNAASAADTDAVKKIVHPSVIDHFKDQGYSDYDILCNIDWYSYGYYGMSIYSWYIEDVDTADMDYIWEMEDLLGIEIDDMLEVEVVVMYEDTDYEEDYDFELIKVDGKWYIMDVW